MARVTRLLALMAAAAMAALGASATSAQEPARARAAGENASVSREGGAAFAMTNRTPDNRIVRYRRAADGTLTRIGSISTRGRGIGTDLDTQAGLILSSDRRHLYACNAGSDDVTVFAVDGTELTFVQRIHVGDEPLSLTIFDNLLYVLLGSVAGNGITGFTVGADGRLTPLPGSFRALSSPISVPGQVQFNPDGRILLVTHKSTDDLVPPAKIIDAFTIGPDGLPSAAPVVNASNGLRPFSLAFRRNGRLVVAESFNASAGRAAASSYDLLPDGTLAVISGSVANGQTDTCWILVTENQRYAFTANFGTGTISSYRFRSSGELTLIDGQAAFTGADSQPVDLAQSADGRYLYLLLRGTGGVAAFRINRNGSLTPLGLVVGGLPVADGASGLAAY